MWNCPNCGERIDDVFEVCWKCGTAHDGTRSVDFQAGSSEADSPDSAAWEDSSSAIDESATPIGNFRNEEIVELCSTANDVEAHALRGLLAEAGIPCQVVGESLGSAAGWLPLGETIAPRLWVRKHDVARAREIVREAQAELTQEEEEPDEPIVSGTASQEDDVTPASSERSLWLGGSILVVGAVCTMLGLIWAAHAWLTVYTYSGAAEGTVARARPNYSRDPNSHTDIPFPRVPKLPSIWYDVQYTFEVRGKTYYTAVRRYADIVDPVAICFDPTNPADNIVGPLTSPWRVLAGTATVGGLLILVGAWLTSRAREPDLG